MPKCTNHETSVLPCENLNVYIMFLLPPQRAVVFTIPRFTAPFCHLLGKINTLTMMEIYASTRVLIYFKLFSAKLSRQAVKFSNSRRRLRPSDLCSHVSTSTTTELTEAILRTCYIPCTPFQRFRMSGWLCVRLCMSFFCGSLLYVFLHAFFVFYFHRLHDQCDRLITFQLVKSYISFFNVFVCLAVSLPCPHLYTTNSSLAVLVCSFFTFILCMSPV